MDYIIEHQYFLAGIGTCLVVVAYFIYHMMKNQPKDPTKVTYADSTEEEEEETVETLTVTFTFIDGTTKKYECENIDLSEGYFELSNDDSVIAIVPFTQVKYADYE